ncbi:membrane protein insertion efficiency factor YidD [Paracoccaceae bacterium GXU_MW_L88]
MTPLQNIAAAPIRAYRLIFSPRIGYGCRFQPTCSAYGLEAIEAHGAFKGWLLTLRRIARCHPLGGSGFDPVPGPKAQKEDPHAR